MLSASREARVSDNSHCQLANLSHSFRIILRTITKDNYKTYKYAIKRSTAVTSQKAIVSNIKPARAGRKISHHECTNFSEWNVEYVRTNLSTVKRNKQK